MLISERIQVKSKHPTSKDHSHCCIVQAHFSARLWGLDLEMGQSAEMVLDIFLFSLQISFTVLLFVTNVFSFASKCNISGIVEYHSYPNDSLLGYSDFKSFYAEDLEWWKT